MPWIQVYDPFGHAWLSTLAAALPTGLLLLTLGVLRWRAHRAALLGLDGPRHLIRPPRGAVARGGLGRRSQRRRRP